MTGSVYLLHLEIAGPARRVSHYLGYADGDVDRHLEQYRRGGGPPLVRAAIAAGAQVMLVRTWSEGKRDGGCLRRSHAGQPCPLCARGRRRAGWRARLDKRNAGPVRSGAKTGAKAHFRL